MTKEEEITNATIDFKHEELPEGAGLTYAFFRGAKWADSHPHWISVEDELPPVNDKDDESEDYLIVDEDGDMVVGYYNKMDKLWFSNDGYILSVTHWCHLPQAPLVTDLNKKDLPPVSWQEGNILVEEKGGNE